MGCREHHLNEEDEPVSEITLLAIDLAKNVFQLCGVDDRGHVRLERRLSRAQLLPALVKQPRCTVVMEACGSAHHWARSFRQLGHTVRLLAPQHVKAFMRGQKNDRNDAQAIACAARQPGIPDVAVKSEEQQAILALHCFRKRLVHERVARTNQLHGLMAEFGVILPKQSPAKLRQVLHEKLEAGALPPLLTPQLRVQLEHLQLLEQQLKQLTGEIEQIAQLSEPCQRLMQLRGVGPIIATTFVCQIGDASTFRNGRQCAASLGLVPRQHSSGNCTRLLGITKRGDGYLRSLLVHGSRSLLRVATRHPEDPLCQWALRVAQRRGANRAAVALANKLARRLWATLRYAEPACA
jgi:transposase